MTVEAMKEKGAVCPYTISKPGQHKSKMESRTCLRESQCLIGNCLTGLSKIAYHSCTLKVAHCHTTGQYASHNQDKEDCQHAQRCHKYSTRLWSRCSKDMEQHNLNKTWSALNREATSEQCCSLHSVKKRVLKRTGMPVSTVQKQKS